MLEQGQQLSDASRSDRTMEVMMTVISSKMTDLRQQTHKQRYHSPPLWTALAQRNVLPSARKGGIDITALVSCR